MAPPTQDKSEAAPPAKAESEAESKKHESFENVSTAILTIATFAAGVTFNILLKPADAGGPPLAVVYLSYANSLFCAALMGCALIKVSIELVKHSVDKAMREAEGQHHFWSNTIYILQEYPDLATAILSFETVFVGTILYVAIFFLLYSTSLFLEVKGPLILALVLYGFFGVLVFLSVAMSLWVYAKLVWRRVRKLDWRHVQPKLGLDLEKGRDEMGDRGGGVNVNEPQSLEITRSMDV